MNHSHVKILFSGCLLLLSGFSLIAQDPAPKKWDGNTVNSVVKITGSDEFGSAGTSVYTPEIRANMKRLYQHKLGLFVHWGPYAQLEGIWDGKQAVSYTHLTLPTKRIV